MRGGGKSYLAEHFRLLAEARGVPIIRMDTKPAPPPSAPVVELVKCRACGVHGRPPCDCRG